MALNREQKEAIVAEVAHVAGSAFSAVSAEYRGLTVSQMTALRSEARKNGVYMRVVKNSLARLAVKDTDFECMHGELTGPLVLAFSQTDPGAAARVIKDFVKTNDKLVVRSVAIGGKLMGAADLETLAKMPTYEQAISILMGTMRAPIQKLVTTLNEVPSKLVRTVAAIKDAKQAA